MADKVEEGRARELAERRMKYSIVTFGCRVNQADSFQIEEQLIGAGGSASSTQDADLVVVNTCSVTSSADQGHASDRSQDRARESRAPRIVVTGCYATRRPDEVAALPGVVQIVPNDRKDSARASDIGLTTAQRFGGGDGACGAEIAPGLAGRTAFTLRVQTGCDQTCSYCIIPSTRGTGRSRPLREVLSEIDRVSACRLSGDRHYRRASRLVRPRSGRRVDATRACSRRSNGMRRACAFASARSSRWIARTRSSISWRRRRASRRIFISRFSTRATRCSSRCAGRTRWRITAGSSIAFAREIPHASIGTDIIVGFPGETDEDFAVLEAYLRESPITHVHVFPYSDRPGTAAAALTGKVHGSIVRERAGTCAGDRPRAEPNAFMRRRTAASGRA